MAAVSVRLRWAVFSTVAVLVLGIAGAAGGLVVNARHVAVAESETQVTRFTAGAEAALNRALLGLDVLLASTDDMIDLWSDRMPRSDPEFIGKLLRSASRQNILVRSAVLLDPRRNVVAASDAMGARMLQELPAGFFDEAMAQGMPTLALSAPTVSFASSERILYAARPIRSAGGERLLAVLQVPVSMLSAVLAQGADIPGLEVTLERGKGELIIGTSGRGEARSRARVPPLGDEAPASIAWDQPARLSGVPSLVAARPILYPGLWITASLPEASALASWRTERSAIAAVAALLIATALAAGGFTMAYLRRISHARNDLARSKATLEQALGSMVSGFVLLDSRHRVLQWNQRYEEIFPWLRSMMQVGLPFRSVLEATSRYHLPDADEAMRREWVEQRLLLQRETRGTHEQMLPNGHFIQITERATPEGGLMITYHDVTEMRRASAEIESLAFYDPLTGLPNRRLLLDRLHQALATAQRSRQFGALLFLDLDQFKTLNDTQGHEMGDLLLQQVALRLRVCARPADTVARLGGDEFVVMMSDLSHDRQEAASITRRIGEKILQAVAQPYHLQQQMHQHTCSVGAAIFGDQRQTAADLLKQADIAMYQVKARRGNALCFFDPQMQVVISQRARLETDLQAAIAAQEFVLYYQPQFSRAGEVIGAEGLLRWKHPGRGLIAPGEFIGVAEESELIVPIGQWVLRTACVQLAAWSRDPRLAHLHVAVNVSARQFRHPDFVASVVEALQHAGVKPHLLELELTESLVLDNVDDSVAKMHLLRTKGVRFSVDDFGTGYSSLAYLTRLPLHQLKIDQSFVRNLGKRPTDDVIVQTIIGMARNLDLEVIAEGVETQEQRDFLDRHGCDLYQGYLFARPMPAQDFLVRYGSAAPDQTA
ncbi:EAL domain-containing protein [Paracidovorax citrulli]|uniref:Diguanylate cyclase/phosphodiesterase n=2 Tax=Paracidovorax citrulli TaxID=80869 RepID=A1TSV4_PARC0|nr:EAL domain-containing protein [Paracidovorax citrulli]ABM34042.1 diguanylate cyclase/phosphodiesterase [Paracidovorax citrulli AAC00-1]PVY63481.1 diguanylate cyclase/phosphodiesterase [Paracidovorax citrulli]REG67552.1 diguanylate cyclase/phosphodiesterase [Paracidovorax citrulli]RLJ92112.1 diguanylate cyclase/phosphodiesterase [Paracidovorax citrulli]UMT82478.1 EAL domain-containing protein [Paracidovorax citrulli]